VYGRRGAWYRCFDRPMRLWDVLLLGLVAASGAVTPRLARAQGLLDPIQLEWRAPTPACPTAERVRADVDELLGGNPRADDNRRVAADARISSTASGRWRLTLRVQLNGAKAGQRTLYARSCQELAEATALIIAFEYDPEVVKSRKGDVPKPDEGTEPSEPPPEPVPSPPTSEGRAPTDPHPSRKTNVGFAVGLSAAGEVGALPSATVGIGLTGALLLPYVRFELEGDAWLPERETTSTRPDTGGQFTFLSGALSGGPRLFVGRVELVPCVGMDLGFMHASGYGVTQPGRASALWRAPLGGVLLIVSTRRIGFRFELVALVPLDRPRWILEEVGEVGQTGVIGGRAEAGAELRF
jgi:hypothetical protein